MEQIINIAIPVMVIFVMFVVGLSLTRADFVCLKTNSKAILLGTLGPFLILPIFAIGLVKTFDLTPNVESGILLIAICPGGGISNYYTYLARSSTALSVSMTGISSILAIVMMPILMSGFVALGLGAEAFAIPFTQLLKQLIVTLILPIVVGMWVRSRYTHFVFANETRFRLVSIGIIICLTGFILSQGPAASFQEWLQITFFSILFFLLAMAAGAFVGYVAALNRSDQFTLMIEYAVQNIALAAVIAVTLMGHLEFATMAAIYFVVQLPMITIAILLYRRKA